MRAGSLVLACLLLQVLPAQGQDFIWAQQMGGTSNDGARSIAVDGEGNVYTTGNFSGTADFDPGLGVFNLTAAGESDVFVSKFDGAGNFVWARRMGGSAYNSGRGIGVDDDGNVYTAGLLIGTGDFDPGAGVFNLTSPGDADVFVSKLDSDGNFVWAKRMGGPSFTQVEALAVDADGNVYTTGRFNGTGDFDPGVGGSNLTSAGGIPDIFVSKLNSSGQFKWARKMGGPSGDDRGRSVAVDADSNVYTTGEFGGTSDFDPGSGSFDLTAVGEVDVFVSKLDSAGRFVWTQQMGGADSNRGLSVAVDANGNVYTTGDFRSTADFDPGAGVFNLKSKGSEDIFVSKLDGGGNFVWAQRMGGTAYDSGASVALDASGNVYTTGEFRSTADFDPGAGVFNLLSAGSEDIFVSKLNSSGNFVWAQRMGGTARDLGTGVALDSSGDIYTTGLFSGTADFDPGAGVFDLNSNGGEDIFVSRLDGGLPLPAISEGGIVLATLLPTVNTVSPLSIITVFGQNFSTETLLFPNLDGNGDLDTILAGTCLMMNGVALPIFAITPGQINAQTSATQALGPASFTVVTDCGTSNALVSETVTLNTRRSSPTPRAQTSNVEMVTVEEATPGFFLFPPLANDGIIAARFNATLTQAAVPVAPASLFPSDSFGPSRPAVPGDIILLYGTGWGETVAGLGAGELASGAAALLPAANPIVTFGGIPIAPEDIFYVGATPGTAGLYQLAIRVPQTAMPGMNQVVLTVYGKSTPVGPVVPVVAAP